MLLNYENYSLATLHVGDDAASEGRYMRAVRKYEYYSTIIYQTA